MSRDTLIPPSATPSPLPLSARICDWLCLGFALWTVCCHTIILLKGNLFHLMIIFPLTFIPAWWLWSKLILKDRSKHTNNQKLDETAGIQPIGSTEDFQKFPSMGIVVLGLVIFISMILVWSKNPKWYWFLSCIILSTAAWFYWIKSPLKIIPAARVKNWEICIWILAVLCVLISFISHRSDADDGFYISVAVSVADHPNESLLQKDTMHGIPELPIHHPAYKVHSLELLMGMISHLTGIPAIYCFHILAAMFFALFVPLSFARFFKIILPRIWLIAVFTLLIVLIIPGETHRWYGNFSLVRMWQGKSIFLSIFLPLIYAYALGFMIKPSRRKWLLLCAAQICAIGATSNALWAAPVACILGLLSAIHLSKRSINNFLLGLTTTAYVLFAGILIKMNIHQISPQFKNQTTDLGQIWGEAFYTSLGNNWLLLLAIGAMVSLWFLAPSSLARRFAISSGIISFYILVNPLLTKKLMKHITGPSYWRVFWGIPIPILITFFLILPLLINKKGKGNKISYFTWSALILIYTICIPQYHGFSKTNKVSMNLQPLKVPKQEYQAASLIKKHLSSPAIVLAPRDVSTWIPTMHHHPYPIEVRHFLRWISHFMIQDDYQLRHRMRLFVTGHYDSLTHTQLKTGLDKYDIKGICISKNKDDKLLCNMLRDWHFYLAAEFERYKIFIKR